jgi:hypothetical protein
MRVLRTVRTIVVLGLYGLALVKALSYIEAEFPAAKARVDKARERMEPALRDATRTLRSASTDVAESVRDVSRSAVEAADTFTNSTGNSDRAVTV